MEAILNFIKEALKGKKMSAQWIVTIAVALAGLTWSATLVWQEYQGMQGKIEKLQKVSHKDRPDYDDAPLSGRVTANSDAIIKLQGRPILTDKVDNNAKTIVGMVEQIKSLESKIMQIKKDIEKAEDKIDNKNVNPLSL